MDKIGCETFICKTFINKHAFRLFIRGFIMSYRTQENPQNLERIAQMEEKELAVLDFELAKYSALRIKLEERGIYPLGDQAVFLLQKRVRQLHEQKKLESEQEAQPEEKEQEELKSSEQKALPEAKKQSVFVSRGGLPKLVNVLGAIACIPLVGYWGCRGINNYYTERRIETERIKTSFEKLIDRNCDQKLTMGDFILSYRYATGKELAGTSYNLETPLEIKIEHTFPDTDIKIGGIVGKTKRYTITISPQMAQEFASKLPPVQCNLKLE